VVFTLYYYHLVNTSDRSVVTVLKALTNRAAHLVVGWWIEEALSMGAARLLFGMPVREPYWVMQLEKPHSRLAKTNFVDVEKRKGAF
jgi:hypothetical protein